jgi:hypothetical protein
MIRPRHAVLLLLIPILAAADQTPQRDAPGRIDGWVPEDVPVLRGIFFEDGSRLLDEWQDVLRLWGYAGMRGAMFAYQGDRDAAIRAAMTRLAERTGHPEILHLPVVASGFSRFSSNADSFANRFPGRVISYASGFDPRYPVDSASQRTPNVKIANEVEDIFAGDRTRRALGPAWTRSGRPLRAFCPQWREIHAFSTVNPFLMAYWDQVQRLRVPADWDPRSGAATLRPVTTEQGWLGDTSGFWSLPEAAAADDPLIAPIAEFPADRADRAAWLPDRETAWLWRAWSSRNPWGSLESPCKPWEPDAGHHLALDLRAGTPVTVTIRVTIPDAAKIEAWAWCEPIGATTAFTGGELGGTSRATATFTWTPAASRVWPILVRVTRRDGGVGWITPAVVPVWPAR